MKKALFIVGPTAVGKTALACKISQKIPSVLISADSIQVYKWLDIISGKDHPKGTEIFLIDVISPFENFSVGKYLRLVKPIIARVLSGNKVPIIVGGTGLYVDSLFTKIDTITIPPNEKLREKLQNKSVEELQIVLRKINPQKISRMNKSDINNKRRLIRAIEVSSSKVPNSKPLFDKDEILMIGLTASMENLKDRIRKRIEERLKMGALDEARKLFVNYKKLSPQIKSANGYKELFEYLRGGLTFEQAGKQWISADYHHAKNQMTWFKRNKNIKWFDIEEKDFESKIIRLIKQSLSNIRTNVRSK